MAELTSLRDLPDDPEEIARAEAELIAGGSRFMQVCWLQRLIAGSPDAMLTAKYLMEEVNKQLSAHTAGGEA